jgi:organic hydroperoxide reductase OsmC/OhrA
MASGREHRYRVTVEWTGNRGRDTSSYRDYDRAHNIKAEGKPDIAGSSDPAFRGDATRWNPEELLVASLSACHQLWYLYLCAVAGVVVVGYVDRAEGLLLEDTEKGGFFTKVILRPDVRISPGSDADKAASLHAEAHKKCFVANSVNFSVVHEATIVVDGAEGGP